MALLDVSAQVIRPPSEIIESGLDHQWTFAVGHGPSEQMSEADPPTLLTDVTDGIVIDGLLGLYNPSTQEITIFRKGINHVAEMLRVSPEDLTQVVRLHEWAHALLHLGLEKPDRLLVLQDESQWADRLDRLSVWFEGIDSDLHETLAQLLTKEGLVWLREKATLPEAQAKIDRIEVVFRQLMRRAPSAYRIDEYDSASKIRIIGGIRLLKSGGLVGFDAWETVMKW